MLITSDRTVMGPRANGTGMKVLGWLTTSFTFLAAGTLVFTWLR